MIGSAKFDSDWVNLTIFGITEEENWSLGKFYDREDSFWAYKTENQKVVGMEFLNLFFFSIYLHSFVFVVILSNSRSITYLHICTDPQVFGQPSDGMSGYDRSDHWRGPGLFPRNLRPVQPQQTGTVPSWTTLITVSQSYSISDLQYLRSAKTLILCCEERKFFKLKFSRNQNIEFIKHFHAKNF